MGMRSTIVHFDALLSRFAPPGFESDDETTSVWLEMVLGAISLRDRLHELLERQPSVEVRFAEGTEFRKGILR